MKYLATLITVISISTVFLAPSAYAQIPNTVNVYAWTDKTHYSPGESGILRIVIRNDRTDEDLILKNISITYPWFAYTGEEWQGNFTMKLGEDVVKKKGDVYTNSIEFTIPKDGKIFMDTDSRIKLQICVDKSPYRYPIPPDDAYMIPLYLKSAPDYTSFEDMDKIVTLFTVQTVLVIVCTIIIAATIFLSARRPRMRWREAPKSQQQ